MTNIHTAPLQEGKYYHIYNRGNNKENIFFKPDNYIYFLRKMDEYLSTYVDWFAYCLLPNHFHFFIRVKDFSTIDETARVIKTGNSMLSDPSKIISEQFRRLFLSYSKAIRIQEDRSGSLFEKKFKRKEIDSPFYFTSIINYIHQNPVKHGVVNDFTNYPYSSYKRILTKTTGKLMRNEILEWFGGMEYYIKHHLLNPLLASCEEFD